jgi:ribosomal protein L25 (general stress protein Ctc)
LATSAAAQSRANASTSASRAAGSSQSHGGFPAVAYAGSENEAYVTVDRLRVGELGDAMGAHALEELEQLSEHLGLLRRRRRGTSIRHEFPAFLLGILELGRVGCVFAAVELECTVRTRVGEAARAHTFGELEILAVAAPVLMKNCPPLEGLPPPPPPEGD